MSHVNEVTHRRVGLVLRWVTFGVHTVLIFNEQSTPTQPGFPQLGQRNASTSDDNLHCEYVINSGPVL